MIFSGTKLLCFHQGLQEAFNGAFLGNCNIHLGFCGINQGEATGVRMIGAQIGMVDGVAPQLNEGQSGVWFVQKGSRALYLIAAIN